MMEFKCSECEAKDKTKVVEQEITVKIKGDTITIVTPIRVCTECDTRVFDRVLDQEMFTKAFNLYRAKHDLITPEEIVDLREKYGLSQKSLAQLLGWGDITIHRYEKGNLPSESHNHLLKSLKKVSNFSLFFEKNRSKLPDIVAEKLAALLAEFDNDEETFFVDFLAQKYEQPSIVNGFRSLSPERLAEMLVYFASKLGGVNKTKALKLCWYSDFVYYLKHSLSFTGSPYVRAPYGPVPDQYDLYINRLSKSGAIEIELQHSGDFVAYVLKSNREADRQVITGDAIEVMDAVLEKYKTMNSSEISDHSHLEEGWKSTKSWDPIAYTYADQLVDWQTPPTLPTEPPARIAIA